MNILQLGLSPLGRRVLGVLDHHDDSVVSADDIPSLEESLAKTSFDWIVSAGFRYKLSEDHLAAASNNCNVHMSLLPWGRGAHPNVWMLARGEPSGVTIHRMSAALDAGPIYGQMEVPSSFADVASTLYMKLEDAAVQLFADIWPKMRRDEIQPVPQSAGGSFHSIADLTKLASIDMDEVLTWREAFDILRALTFPPYENLVVERGGRRFHVEVRVKEIGDQSPGSTPP